MINKGCNAVKGIAAFVVSWEIIKALHLKNIVVYSN